VSDLHRERRAPAHLAVQHDRQTLMALIRSKRTDNNTSGRGGCELWSPYSNGIYYLTVEHGEIVVRGWGDEVLAKDGPVRLAGPHVSACFANPGHIAVTIVGFDPGTNNSGIDTYLFPLEEG
jgi:hypothetical protein